VKKQIYYVLPLLIFIAMGALFWKALSHDPSLLPSARIGKAVPEFELTRLSDVSQAIGREALLGEVSLLNVWATWCPSCRVEHPMLLKLAQQGVLIRGLNYKDERSAAQSYLRNHGDPYEWVIYDEKGSLGLDLGVYGAPETYVIDHLGFVRFRHVGVVSSEVWLGTIKPVVDQLKQQALESQAVESS